MQTHIIKNGVVVNTILATVAEAQSAYPEATCIDGATGGIGWLWDGDTLTAPPAKPPPRTRTDVLADLATIDTKSIRALRENNTARIAELEAQAVALRAELAGL